jgi:hypothetical protein
MLGVLMSGKKFCGTGGDARNSGDMRAAIPKAAVYRLSLTLPSTYVTSSLVDIGTDVLFMSKFTRDH